MAVSDNAIAKVLRESIRQRMLPPGMPLIQQSIADAMGVSRIPVREALQRLAAEGLVTFGDDGAHVTELTPAEIEELWSLRAVIEPAMAEAIAERVTRDQLDALEALVARMDDTTDVDAWSNANYAFHDGLYKAAALAHYRTVALRVLTLIEPYSRVAADLLEQRPVAQAEHHEMIDAIRRRDAGRLAELLRFASIRARDVLMAYAERGAEGHPPHDATDAARRLAEQLVTG